MTRHEEGSQDMADHEARGILDRYFPDGEWRTLDMKGRGMNNTTSFVEANGERYVLRIYETHRDPNKVAFEHAVLSALAESRLPLRTPVPAKTPEGETVVRTPSGKLAALFRYMEGEPPRLQDADQLYAFGKAAALLSMALANVSIPLEPAYRPYYEIEQTHPRCGIEQLIRFCARPTEPFSSPELAGALANIGERLIQMAKQLPGLRALPHQLIHGDLNASNALADRNGAITAILDFEFVTRDLRVMEAAVCLSDLIRPEGRVGEHWEKIEALFTGYGANVHLTADEVSAVPTLLLLRRLDVFIHFLGRYWDGVDEAGVVEDQIRSTAAMAHWLDEHEEKLLDVLRKSHHVGGRTDEHSIRSIPRGKNQSAYLKLRRRPGV